MKHVVSLSGGMASACAAIRVCEQYSDVVLWFADTKWEDQDTYRFNEDIAAYVDKPLIIYTDGRTPLEVFSDQHIIPNSLIAPCSRELKINQFIEFITHYHENELLTVHLGLDWSEIHRHKKPKETYEKYSGVTVHYPLMDKPYILDYDLFLRERGIEPPRMYQYGFPHNNCGGRCIRQGKGEWERLKAHFPDRFNEVALWEKSAREDNPYTIVREVRNGVKYRITLEDLGNRDGCFCEV